MTICNIKKSNVWDEGNPEMDLTDHNDAARQAGKPYFAYGQVIFMVWYPFSVEYCRTGFFKKDLIG